MEPREFDEYEDDFDADEDMDDLRQDFDDLEDITPLDRDGEELPSLDDLDDRTDLRSKINKKTRLIRSKPLR